jgi:hypothetical protein
MNFSFILGSEVILSGFSSKRIKFIALALAQLEKFINYLYPRKFSKTLLVAIQVTFRTRLAQL